MKPIGFLPIWLRRVDQFLTIVAAVKNILHVLLLLLDAKTRRKSMKAINCTINKYQLDHQLINRKLIWREFRRGFLVNLKKQKTRIKKVRVFGHISSYVLREIAKTLIALGFREVV